MTMREILPLAAALAVGLLLGAVFFGGLWWTVVRGVSSQRPALWFVGSKLLRLVIVLGGFYLVGRDHWERWMACLLGFVLARIVVWGLTRPPAQERAATTPQARYAP
jgi:F1F0 ATPase subunit 2